MAKSGGGGSRSVGLKIGGSLPRSLRFGMANFNRANSLLGSIREGELRLRSRRNSLNQRLSPSQIEQTEASVISSRRNLRSLLR